MATKTLDYYILDFTNSAVDFFFSLDRKLKLQVCKSLVLDDRFCNYIFGTAARAKNGR